MKKMFLKKTVSLMLIVVALLMSTVTAVSAAVPEGESVVPLWVSIYNIEVDIDFDGNIGTAIAAATKKSTATSIEGTLSVYGYIDEEWVLIDSWYKSVSRGSLGLVEEFEAASGVQYKAVFEVTAYTGTVPESETFEIVRTCP